MRVLIVKPRENPYEAEIESDLKSIQTLVGGRIEAVNPYKDRVVIICNADGKLLGMPMNRAVYDENGQVRDIVYGIFLVAGVSEDDFDSLTDDLIKKYSELFWNPE